MLSVQCCWYVDVELVYRKEKIGGGKRRKGRGSKGDPGDIIAKALALYPRDLVF